MTNKKDQKWLEAARSPSNRSKSFDVDFFLASLEGVMVEGPEDGGFFCGALAWPWFTSEQFKKETDSVFEVGAIGYKSARESFSSRLKGIAFPFLVNDEDLVKDNPPPSRLHQVLGQRQKLGEFDTIAFNLFDKASSEYLKSAEDASRLYAARSEAMFKIFLNGGRKCAKSATRSRLERSLKLLKDEAPCPESIVDQLAFDIDLLIDLEKETAADFNRERFQPIDRDVYSIEDWLELNGHRPGGITSLVVDSASVRYSEFLEVFKEGQRLGREDGIQLAIDRLVGHRDQSGGVDLASEIVALYEHKFDQGAEG